MEIVPIIGETAKGADVAPRGNSEWEGEPCIYGSLLSQRHGRRLALWRCQLSVKWCQLSVKCCRVESAARVRPHFQSSDFQLPVRGSARTSPSRCNGPETRHLAVAVLPFTIIARADCPPQRLNLPHFKATVPAWPSRRHVA